MGTLIGHILGGVGFLLIGLWHLFNTIRNYVEAPWSFQSRAWFPTRWPGEHFKYLELHFIIFGSCLSIAAELFIGPVSHQPFADDWSIPSTHLNNFEHSSISLFFLVYGVVCLVSDIMKIHLPRGSLHIMGAFAFSQELMLFHFHSADHMGLEGQYHWLLQLPIIGGLLAALLEVVAPRVFIVSFLRSVSILLQGLLFIQMGLTLYVGPLVPTGCAIVKEDVHRIVRCGTPQAGMRAKALANLYFSWYLIAVLVFSIVLYVSMAYNHRGRQLQYEPLLGNLTADSLGERGRTSEDVQVATSPRISQGDGSHSLESEIEMQSMADVPWKGRNGTMKPSQDESCTPVPHESLVSNRDGVSKPWPIHSSPGNLFLIIT